MYIDIKNVSCVYKYRTPRARWECASPRSFHTMSFQVTGDYEHTVDGRILRVKRGCLFFINGKDAYTVKRFEEGESICAIFYGKTDLSTTLMDCNDDPRVERIFVRLMKKSNMSKESNKLFAISAIYELFSIISEKNSEVYIAKNSRERIAVLHRYITENYREPDFTLDGLPLICNIGMKQIRNLFKAKYGTTPLKYLTDLRMKAAVDLLSQGTLTVSEIAAMCGYRDVYYFSRVFKEYFLVSPSKYVSEKTDG